MSFKKTLMIICIISTLAAGGAYKVGFDLLRAGAVAEDGQIHRHSSAFMNKCGKARVTSIGAMTESGV
jgi:hypothetical protein